MEIVDDARKHGVQDEDMIHAYDNAILVHILDGYLMLVGPARDGRLLEIGYNTRRDRIFHADNARRKFL